MNLQHDKVTSSLWEHDDIGLVGQVLQLFKQLWDEIHCTLLNQIGCVWFPVL